MNSFGFDTNFIMLVERFLGVKYYYDFFGWSMNLFKFVPLGENNWAPYLGYYLLMT